MAVSENVCRTMKGTSWSPRAVNPPSGSPLKRAPGGRERVMMAASDSATRVATAGLDPVIPLEQLTSKRG